MQFVHTACLCVSYDSQNKYELFPFLYQTVGFYNGHEISSMWGGSWVFVLSVSVFRGLKYLLTPRSRVLLEKLTVNFAASQIPRIYGTQKSLTVPTSARHLSLSWANSIQSPRPPPPSSWRFILILSSHLRLCLPNGLFPTGFPTSTLCTR
jgi:hypothetical protein